MEQCNCKKVHLDNNKTTPDFYLIYFAAYQLKLSQFLIVAIKTSVMNTWNLPWIAQQIGKPRMQNQSILVGNRAIDKLNWHTNFVVADSDILDCYQYLKNLKDLPPWEPKRIVALKSTSQQRCINFVTAKIKSKQQCLLLLVGEGLFKTINFNCMNFNLFYTF